MTGPAHEGQRVTNDQSAATMSSASNEVIAPCLAASWGCGAIDGTGARGISAWQSSRGAESKRNLPKQGG